MDFELPPDDDPRRVAVRAWLAEHPSPDRPRSSPRPATSRRTGRAPWGLDADPIHQLIIDDELAAAGVAPAGQPDRHRLGRPDDPLRRHRGAEGALPAGRCSPARSSGASCSPSPAAAATSPSSARGPCATATSSSSTARRSGRAARSTPGSASSSPAPTPTLPKHKGISYFICPMDAPGIEIRPITEMTGGHTFNEVFFTDVRIPAANLVGELERRLAAGQGDARQRAHLAVDRRRAVGQRPDGARPDRGGRGRRAGHRPDAAPAARRGLHRAHRARADPACAR